MGPLHGAEKKGFVYRVKKVRIYVKLQLYQGFLRDFRHGIYSITVDGEQPDRSFDIQLQVDT